MSANPSLNPFQVRNLRPGMVILTHQSFTPKYMLVTCVAQVEDGGGAVYVTLSTLSPKPTESSLFCSPGATFLVVEEVKHPHQDTPEWDTLVEKYGGLGDRLSVLNSSLDSLRYVSQIRESMARMGYESPGVESVDEIRAYLLEEKGFLTNKLSKGSYGD